MENTMTCKCGSSKVKMINALPLAEGEAFEGQPYIFDNEVYATAKCEDCGQETPIIGKITWEKR